MSPPELLLVPQPIWQMTLEVFANYAAIGLEAGCFWYGTKDSEKALVGLLGVPREPLTSALAIYWFPEPAACKSKANCRTPSAYSSVRTSVSCLS